MLYIIISPKIIFYNLILRTWIMQSWSNIVNSWCNLKFWVTPFLLLLQSWFSIVNSCNAIFWQKQQTVVKRGEGFFCLAWPCFYQSQAWPCFHHSQAWPCFHHCQASPCLAFYQSQALPCFHHSQAWPCFHHSQAWPCFHHCQAWPCIIPNLSLCTAEC